MNCYLAVATNLVTDDVVAIYSDALKVCDGAWVFPAADETCAEVAERLGMNNTRHTIGIVVSVDDYYGYYNKALWDKISAWKAR